MLTLAQRREKEAGRRRAAARSVRAALADEARRLGGRYLLYGSAAAERMGADSDIDLLLDFPSSVEAEAWRFAEAICCEHGLPFDIMPLAWADAALATRVRTRGVSLA
jgi:predicted nucleotidyltransferase